MNIKQIHLKGNELRQLPGQLFLDLPNLVWFDARDNQLR